MVHIYLVHEACTTSTISLVFTHTHTETEMCTCLFNDDDYAKALLSALYFFLPVFTTRGALDAKMSVAAVLVGLSSSRGRFLPTDAVS